MARAVAVSAARRATGQKVDNASSASRFTSDDGAVSRWRGATKMADPEPKSTFRPNSQTPGGPLRAVRGRGPTAVIYEDEPLVRATLTLLLERRGYQVLAFESPASCLTPGLKECRHPPGSWCADVVLSDVNMPGGNGLDYVVGLRARGCRCPHIALMSATWLPADEERARQLGCRVFRKPVPAGQLDAWLTEAERQLAGLPLLAGGLTTIPR